MYECDKLKKVDIIGFEGTDIKIQKRFIDDRKIEETRWHLQGLRKLLKEWFRKEYNKEIEIIGYTEDNYDGVKITATIEIRVDEY